MKTTEMNILRIKGVSLKEQIRNKTIRNELDIQNIVRWMRARRQWRDHIDRMGPEISKGDKNMQTTRPSDKPPKRWHESWTSGSQEV